MSPDYHAWAERHAKIFGLTTDGDADMLTAWCELFAAAGITPAELHEATAWIATNAPPRYRSDHLAAIQQRVKARRQQQTLRPQEQPQHPLCSLCGSGGFVEVPAGGLMTAGGNVIAEGKTILVLCRCPLGLWKAQQPGGAIFLKLQSYESGRPYWREEMDRINAERSAGVKAHSLASGLDRALGAILGRLGVAQETRQGGEAEDVPF